MRENSMSNVEQAIKEAVEKGGYNQMIYDWPLCSPEIKAEHVFLDPLFWQELGKARGWDNSEYCICSVTGKRAERNPAFLADCLCHRNAARSWENQWHCFIDHLAEGKDAESFFAALIRNKD